MSVRRNISALFSVVALLVATVIAPASSVAASHACCPPEMVGNMNPQLHMVMMAQMSDQNDMSSEQACDFSCCGLAISVADSLDTDSSVKDCLDTSELLSLTQSQLVSVPLAIQSPPPKSL